MTPASITRPSSSSSTTTTTSVLPPWTYDVFLSFRGKDTRENFTDHLYTALIGRGIRTFRDDEEIERGSEITPKLSKAIQESRFCLVVFSKGYAHSRWCLNELVWITDDSCVEENGPATTIIPVFYHVDPRDVRNQTGSFQEAFLNHEKQNEEETKRWRAALREVSNISGWHLHHGYESVLIKKITNDICKRLSCKTIHVGEKIVGMDSHLGKLNSLINIKLNEVRVIGIYGIGGVGKTTIAKAVYNTISYQFDGSSFLGNVRETGNRCGVLQLQQKLLRDVLKGRNIKLHSIDEGISAIKDRLHAKRVLIVVDDVDDLCQLEYIVGEHHWFCAGSRIIITTRDKHLLDVHGVDETYEAKELNHEKSVELFSRHAFKQRLPEDDYKILIERAINYAKGLPLALKVLGIFLYGKTVPEWESSLCKLERKLPMEIQSVLKISFDGLDDVEKEIFLDIVCFFKGEDKDFVSRILDSCNFYAESGLRVLVDKCLLTINNNIVDMHDLLQHMGWEIIRKQCLKEPGKRSRVWQFEDVHHVLTRNTGTKAIEGIALDMSLASKQIQFTTKAFRKMKRLRLLKVHHDAQNGFMMKHCKDVQIPKVGHPPGDFTFPSYDLRYLHWDGYPLKSLPSSFLAENLVELSLQSSSVEELWNKKVFEKLKVLNVGYSQHLVKIPDSSSMPNIEKLIVRGCENLTDLPSDIYKLKLLKTLCCSGCSKLTGFPEIKEVMGNLREVYLDRTGIRYLPWSIEHLKGILHLDLAHCESLESLPDSIFYLKSLKNLVVRNCSKLCKFSDPFWSRERFGDGDGDIPFSVASARPGDGFTSDEWTEFYLEEVDSQGYELFQHGNPQQSMSKLERGRSQLDSPMLKTRSPEGSGIVCWEDERKEEILSSGCSLCWLEELDLSYCNLEEGGITSEVFCNIPSLKMLNLSGNNFCKLPSNISDLSKLRILKINHCKLLTEIPELPSSVWEIDAHGCPSLLPLARQTRLLHSFLNCFKSNIQDFERGFGSSNTFVPGSQYDGKGISLFIDRKSRAPSKMRPEDVKNEATIHLPLNWYEDNNLLGVSLFSVHVPDNGCEEKPQGHEFPTPRTTLRCELSFHGDRSEIVDGLFWDCFCGCCSNGGSASDQVWMSYYPKVGVREMCHSNDYIVLKASFRGAHDLKVESCGIDLIYAKDDGSGEEGIVPEVVKISRNDDSEQKSVGEHPRKRLRGTSIPTNL